MFNYFMLGVILLSTEAFCVRVTVKQGVLEGTVVDLVTKDGTYNSFKGIPYSKAPVGPLRFKDPQPPEPWTGIRNASVHGAKCAQNFANSFSNSEDCLFLNVYSQNLTPTKPMPVVFYIHGGAYRIGSGNSDEFGPDFLVQKGVVVVTINFRLWLFGFLSLDTEKVPGNAGLKDQVAALKWVKENIAVFGGDPAQVTIMGQSSGGASVGFHIFSPMSKGLFNRAIIMSGTPVDDWNLSYESKRRAFDAGKKLGHYSTDPEELLTFLQNATTSQLLGIVPDVLAIETLSSYFFKYFQFTPNVEVDYGQQRFIVEEPMKSLIKGAINDVEIFIGHTNAEGAAGAGVFPSYFENFDYYPELLPPRRVTLNCKPKAVLEIADTIRDFYFGKLQISNSTIKNFIDYVSDIGFKYGTNKFANEYALTSKKSVYFYEFSGYTPERNRYGSVALPYGIKAAAHNDDLQYLFNAESAKIPITKGTDAYRLVNLTSTIFTNFVKKGNPTPDNSLGLQWPTYDYATRKYVDINLALTKNSFPSDKGFEFWEGIYNLVLQC